MLLQTGFGRDTCRVHLALIEDVEPVQPPARRRNLTNASFGNLRPDELEPEDTLLILNGIPPAARTWQ